MCRNIKTLHNFEPPATDEEIRASAVQFVRKLDGFTRPSKANEAAFARAVERVSGAARAARRARHEGARGRPFVSRARLPASDDAAATRRAMRR
jgi:hypothetical protein